MAMFHENEVTSLVPVSVSPSWAKRPTNQPSSVAQSLFLWQINDGASKRTCNLKAVIARQVSQNRVALASQNILKPEEPSSDLNAHKRGKGKKTNKTEAVSAIIRTEYHGLTLITQRHQSKMSPHLILNNSTTSGSFLYVVDGKICWSLPQQGSTYGEGHQGQELHWEGRGPTQLRSGSEDQQGVSFSVAFARIEPALNKFLGQMIRIDTQRKSFGLKSLGFFCTSNSFPISLKDHLHPSHLKKLRHTLFIVASPENSLQLYDVDSGQLHDYIDFNELNFTYKVSCERNGNIIFKCAPSWLPPEILTEFSIFKYPHHRMETKVRISKPAELQNGKTTVSIDFCNDFILVTWPSSRVEFFELEMLLQAAQVVKVDADVPDNNGYSTTTYLIEKLPKPLFSLKAEDVVLNPGWIPLYIIVQTKVGFEVRELFRNDNPTEPQLSLIGGPLAEFKRDDKVEEVNFSQFESGPTRIIVKERTRIRIYKIVRRDEDNTKHGKPAVLENDTSSLHHNLPFTKSSSYLHVIFDKEFLNEETRNDNCQDSESNVVKRAGRRNIPRKSYSHYQNMELCYDENMFLGQMAIARFAEGSVRCYVYNMSAESDCYQLQYTVEPSFFQPKECEIYDEIYLRFTTQFIALIRKGTRDKSAYIFNLMKGLE